GGPRAATRPGGFWAAGSAGCSRDKPCRRGTGAGITGRTSGWSALLAGACAAAGRTAPQRIVVAAMAKSPPTLAQLRRLVRIRPVTRARRRGLRSYRLFPGCGVGKRAKPVCPAAAVSLAGAACYVVFSFPNHYAYRPCLHTVTSTRTDDGPVRRHKNRPDT